MKVQGKLNMHIISESVLMMLTENYHNWSMLVEATACKIWRVFLRHSVYRAKLCASVLRQLQEIVG